MILYSKSSRERRSSFMIRTDLIEEGGKRRIRKCAAGKGAEEHIAALARHCEALKKQFENSSFVPNACILKDGAAEFDCLSGKPLETEADLLLQKDLAEAEAFLLAFLSELDSLADTAFTQGEEFVSVFGDHPELNGTPASSVSDIDLILSNVFRTDRGLEVVDYEWTFDFPVPILYVKWRCLFYYIREDQKRAVLDLPALLKKTGVDDALAVRFREMETSFQEYVIGDTIPKRDLYRDISPGVLDVRDLLKGDGSFVRGRLTGSIYRDTGNDFSEYEREEVTYRNEGETELAIALDGLLQLRIDPLEQPCIVTIHSLFADEEELSVRGVVVTNGLFAGDRTIVFGGEDPWIRISSWPKGKKELRIAFEVRPLERPVVAVLGSFLEEAANEQQRRLFELALRDELLRERDALAMEIKDTKGGKLLSLAGKHYFDGFRPALVPDPNTLFGTIETTKRTEEGILVTGYCYDRDMEIEEVLAVDEKQEALAAVVERIAAPAIGAEGISRDRVFAFSLKLSGQDAARYHSIRIRSLRGVLLLNGKET